MSIYQHFRPEEKDFIDQAMNWIDQVKNSYAPKLSDFLDPRQQEILTSLLGNDPDAKLQFNGGSDFVERKRVLIYPDYYSPEPSDFNISLYDISYPKKFVTLEHRQILGTLMSLGVKREKFGDIIVTEEHIQFIAAGEMDLYLTGNLEKIGSASVSIKRLPIENIIQVNEKWEEQVTTVSSLRLDSVLSSVLNMSRQKTQALITSGKVKVNFKQTENVSEECREGDTLSIRGFGRCKIASIDGKTKKDKWRISLGRQK
ncbi:RNA-binding protein [Peribacillus simplex]|uniref:RNA-binding protein n=1 Tax=Peribacillus simplex TaxID=1478 RepID=A0AAW7II21_9BACI|nr:RNA-binding protein [Peribacillus simplex]AMM92387.1 RNA-binding protein S4 [Peribacillus simplex]MDM5295531.1 RNA-binding protein [Peribacillus simplex]MDM5454538.1 RNA-binding protein [Peribacillus simplex]SNS97104.1 RNA-binding protein YlmH, contains S4-like domain [Bacillus sp. OK838]